MPRSDPSGGHATGARLQAALTTRSLLAGGSSARPTSHSGVPAAARKPAKWWTSMSTLLIPYLSSTHRPQLHRRATRRAHGLCAAGSAGHLCGGPCDGELPGRPAGSARPPHQLSADAYSCNARRLTQAPRLALACLQALGACDINLMTRTPLAAADGRTKLLALTVQVRAGWDTEMYGVGVGALQVMCWLPPVLLTDHPHVARAYPGRWRWFCCPLWPPRASSCKSLA